jgi:threonine dehydrogenase-like Zn-dependent dehydrogenase
VLKGEKDAQQDRTLMDTRKAVLYGKGDLRIETASIPDVLGPQEVLVATEVSALSTGTDLGNYLGDSTYVPGAPDYPRAVGYSNAGRVIAAGSEVTSLTVGDRVFSTKPHLSHFIASASDLMVRIPEPVTSATASLAYLTGLGLAALRQARYEPGENVVVVGLGVIGLSTVALARAMGANVLGVANSDIRARAALKMGATGCLLSDDAHPVATMRTFFRGLDADIVILTSNSWESYFLSLDLVRRGGRVSILGFPGRLQPMPERNPLDPSPFYSKQLALFGAGAAPRLECGPEDVRFNLRRNLEYILDLMASGRIDLAPLITHRLPADQMRTAYERAREHSKDLIAAVFEWGEVRVSA